MVLTTEWAQIEVVDLVNEGNGLGFNIVGGRSTGVVVKTLVAGGGAERTGRPIPGDHLLQAGAVNLRGFTSEQVAAVLRQSGGSVRLLVARPVDPAASDLPDQSTGCPIVPTKLLADPELLDRHLVENGYDDIYNAIPQCYEESVRQDGETPESHPPYPFTSFLAMTVPVECEEIQQEAPRPEPPPLPSPPEMETVSAVLHKNVYGLGLTVAGYVCEKEELSGIFVKSVIEGGAAEISGNVRINDRIISVDGISLADKTNPRAVELLKETGVTVRLELERYLRGPKYEHIRLALAAERGESPPSPASPSADTLSWFQINTDREEESVVERDMESAERTTAESPTLDADRPTPEGSPEKMEVEEEDGDGEKPPEERVTEIQLEDVRVVWADSVGPDRELVVAEINKLAGLGISLEGTVDVEGGREVRPHHYIRSILPQGPVGVQGALKAGDELLQVNEYKLHGLGHSEVVAILKDLPSKVTLVCARDPSDGGPRPLIDVSQDREGFETRKIISGSLRNLAATIVGSASVESPEGSRTVTPPIERSRSPSPIRSRSPSPSPSESRKSASLECVSNLAMWSDEIETVRIEKGDSGLGFSILDYQDPVDPNGTVIVVRSLVPGGAAERLRCIAPGDRLLSVNGVNIGSVTLDQAVHALKTAPFGIVELGVARPLPSVAPSSRKASSAGNTIRAAS